MQRPSFTEKTNHTVALLALFVGAGSFKSELRATNLDFFVWYPSWFNLAVLVTISLGLIVYLHSLELFLRDLGALPNKLSKVLQNIYQGLFGVLMMYPVIVLAGFLVGNLTTDFLSTAYDYIANLATGIVLGILVVQLNHRRNDVREDIQVESELPEGVSPNPPHQKATEKDSMNLTNHYRLIHEYSLADQSLRKILENKGFNAYKLPSSVLRKYAKQANILSEQASKQLEELSRFRNELVHKTAIMDATKYTEALKQLDLLRRELEKIAPGDKGKKN